MITYKIDVIGALREAGYSTYRLRNDAILGSRTLSHISAGREISWGTLDTVCRLLGLQPGDILARSDDHKTTAATASTIRSKGGWAPSGRYADIYRSAAQAVANNGVGTLARSKYASVIARTVIATGGDGLGRIWWLDASGAIVMDARYIPAGLTTGSAPYPMLGAVELINLVSEDEGE